MEFIIIVLGIILDRATKLWALNYFKTNQDIIIVKNYLNLTYLENRGAAWGIFQNKIVFLSIITSLVIIGIIIYMVKNRSKSKLLKISLSLIISGALGNLFDRVYYNYVVDFIFFHVKDVYYYPVFNVADCLVVVGTILFAIYIIWYSKDE